MTEHISRRSFLGAAAALPALITTTPADGIPSSRESSTPRYVGLVGQRPRMCQSYDLTYKQSNSRYAVIACCNISALKIVGQNFLAGSGDDGLGTSATIAASIEYPAGVFTQILFGGNSSGTIANGRVIFSDEASISIPMGATFWIRQYVTASAGILFNRFTSHNLGDRMEVATSGLPDKTMGGTITDSGNSFSPLAVIGLTDQPSIIVIGDSIAFGAGDTDDATFNGRMGIVCKAFPTTLAFCNLSSPDIQARYWLTDHAARKQILPYCSHIICELGINDIQAGQTPDQLISSLQAIAALSAAKFIQTTLIPFSDSTDGWATTANQTAKWLTQRNSFNIAVRAHAAGNSDYFDTAGPLEAVAGDGLWISKVSTPSPGGPYTSDGRHPSASAYSYVSIARRAIDLSKIHYP
jgi:hypothetical protein